MGKFYKMMKHYAETSGGDKQKMDELLCLLDEHFEEFEEMHKEEHWELVRDIHKIFCGAHFNEEFAMWQVSMMHHKGADGKIYKGEHWSMEDTDAVMAKYKSMLPAGTTPEDMYVSLNANYHDKCTLFKKWFAEEYEEKIIEDAISFYFLDEDAPEGKVWYYMSAMDGNE